MTLREIGVVVAAILFFMLAGIVKLSGAPAPAESSQTAVFVTLPMTNGFTDATHALIEAHALVRTTLAGVNDVRLVDRADEADVVVTVLSRGRGDVELTAALQSLADGVGASPVPIATNERFIEAMVTVGLYQRAFVGTGLGDRDRARAASKQPPPNSWDACATALVKDLRAWLNENATRIRARR